MTIQLLQNRYRIIQSLGTGGFGETFLAEDTQMPSGRCCVIKQLKPMANDARVYQVVQERFQREAAILETLGNGHDQIPTLYGHFCEADRLYLVQEWVEGETLSQRVQRTGPLSEAEAKEILENLLSILDYVHSHKIIHRDIKPDNIILRQRDNQPVLIDFGAVKEILSTVVSPSGNARSIAIGTQGFMPSEQISGQPIYASDLYALGLTAIYLMTAKIPQEMDRDLQTGKILWGQETLSVQPHFARVLEQAVNPHARDRFATARAMLNALQFSIGPSSATEVSLSSPPPTIPQNLASPQLEPSQPPIGDGGSGSKTAIASSLIIGGSILAGLSLVGLALVLALKQAPAPQSVESPAGSSVESVEPGAQRSAPSGLSPEQTAQTIPSPAQSPNPVGSPAESPSPVARSQPHLTRPSVLTERLRFKPGTTGEIVSGSISPNQVKRYILNCAQGQQFTLQVTQGTVNVAIVGPQGQVVGTAVNGTTTWQGKLPSNGDYTVEISAPNASAYEISLTVLTITDRNSGQAPKRSTAITERVRFRPGATGTTLHGSVTAQQRQRYLLGCSKDQQFTVQVLHGQVDIKIVAPTQHTLGTISRGNSQWQGFLPSTGDYAVEISAPNGSDYAISIEVL